MQRCQFSFQFEGKTGNKSHLCDDNCIDTFLLITPVDFLLHTQEKWDWQLPPGPLGGPKIPLLEPVGET